MPSTSHVIDVISRIIRRDNESEAGAEVLIAG